MIIIFAVLFGLTLLIFSFQEDVFSANTVTVPVSDGTRVPCSLNVAPLKDFTGRTFLLLAVLTPL
jgi:hypothetical protein